MEYVDRATLKVPQAWLDYADEVIAELVGARDERKKLLGKRWDGKNKASTGYRELKRNLLQLNGGRCWYCETGKGRSRQHIDHFRPKSIARNFDRSVRRPDGYWWLAFDHRNFRIACELCNTLSKEEHADGVTRGKGDYFPLFDEDRTVQANLADERPLILDPCVEAESQLLEFEFSTGLPKAAPNANTDECRRVEVTAIRLNLDDAGLCARRRKKIAEAESAVRSWQDLSEALELVQGDVVSEKVREVLQAQLDVRVSELRELLAEEADYRSIVRRHLEARLTHEPVLRDQVFGEGD